MKKVDVIIIQCCLVIILALLICIFYKTSKSKQSTQEEIEIIEDTISDTLSISREDTLIAMAKALAIQETKCHNIVSADGRYAGYLQISESMVKEANNILGYECYHTNDYIDDRMDWYGSLAIMTTIMDKHNPELDIDRAINIWNKYCPTTYRKQVKTYYEFLLNC